MIFYKVISKDKTDRCLTYKQLRLKEAFYRAFEQDYTIIYPDGTKINVQFER